MDGRTIWAVIEKLEHLNVLDDFIIVFLSDHGEMLGTKGLWEKQSYFEASARVPLSIWYPKRFGREPKIIEQNVSLVDLFPTICELVDIPAPDELDGRSFLPLIDEMQPTGMIPFIANCGVPKTDRP